MLDHKFILIKCKFNKRLNKNLIRLTILIVVLIKSIVTVWKGYAKYTFFFNSDLKITSN